MVTVKRIYTAPKEKAPQGAFVVSTLCLVGEVEVHLVEGEGTVVYSLGFFFLFGFLESFCHCAEEFTDVLLDHGLQVFGGQFAEVDHDTFLSVWWGVPRFDACHYTLEALEYNNRSSGRQTVGVVTGM